MEKGRFSISADDLYQRLGSAAVFLDGKVRFTATDKIFVDCGAKAGEYVDAFMQATSWSNLNELIGRRYGRRKTI
jgi:hypothetical protein